MTDPDRITEEDAALSLLLDDALPAADAERWRRRIAAEPALARRLEELRGVDEALRGVYGGIADEPLPARLTALLKPPASVASFPPKAQPRPFRVSPAMAAGLALAAGFALAFLVLPRDVPAGPLDFMETGGGVNPDSGMYAVLQELPTLGSRVLDSGWAATPRLTFLNGSGDPCRRVDLSREGDGLQTLACRIDGAWRLEVIGVASAGGSTDGFQPAGGGPASAVDAAIDEMIDGSPLDRQAEARWLDGGWVRPGADRP